MTAIAALMHSIARQLAYAKNSMALFFVAQCKQEAQLSLTNRAMLFCKVVEVLQDVLSD